MAQLVKCPTLGFGSGHGLGFRELEPRIRLLLTAQSLLEILSLPVSLSFSAPPRLTLCLSRNEQINLKKVNVERQNNKTFGREKDFNREHKKNLTVVKKTWIDWVKTV